MPDTLRQPPFTPADAIALARKLYGLSVTARQLPGERDRNFHLQDNTGRQFVLKISHAAEQKTVLDMQNRAMAHLARQGDYSLCPRALPAQNGDDIATATAPGGTTHFVRLLTHLPGASLATANPHPPQLLRRLGRFMGHVTRALQSFTHPAAHRRLEWDMQHAGQVIAARRGHIQRPERRAIVGHFLSRFETRVLPDLPRLRRSVIHNDANDYNLLLFPRAAPATDARQFRLIDFGDMVYSHTIFELAVAAAYAILNKPEPLRAAAEVVGGYHRCFPLTPLELEHLFTLVCIRLCTSVVMSASRQAEQPDNRYLSISEKPAWAALKKLAAANPNLAHYTFRQACGLPPCPHTEALTARLAEHAGAAGPVLPPGALAGLPPIVDLSIAGPDAGSLTRQRLAARLEQAGAQAGVGRYNEVRLVTGGVAIDPAAAEWVERPTVHLGLDLFARAGTPVLAPFDGTVHSARAGTPPSGNSLTVVLEHAAPGGPPPFYTLYRGLSDRSPGQLPPNGAVRRGDQIGVVGEPPQNDSRPPRLHLQLITDMLGMGAEFPGLAPPGERETWLSLCPNPNLILNLPHPCAPEPDMSRDQILTLRAGHIGPSLSVAYRAPLKIMRGVGQYLFNEAGQPFLDGVNNVCHVGHCHPHVVQAAQRQLAVLNTNTRYLHHNLARYAQRLTATLPDPLRVCFFVCSGSEANELALRLARAHTGRTDMLVLDGAYHGNTSALIGLSPYKFNGPGGSGPPAHTHTVILPDGYRGPYKSTDPQAGQKYARHVRQAIEDARRQGRDIAGFLCESLPGCGGQIVFPSGYLPAAYRHVRAAGGVCIADEVQVGFGRVGTHFWGFQTQGVVPDIVTMGKPMGNGHPLAAVVTTPQIAASFNNGMEYFNTYGGNPVSCAVGLAVLEVIEAEQLQQNALRVGRRLRAGLAQLMAKYPLIGEVRGAGLFIGVELVADRATLAPAAAQAAYIIERMKDHGILLSTDGPLHNVIKIKPPLVFSADNADFLVAVLDRVLAEDPSGP